MITLAIVLRGDAPAVASTALYGAEAEWLLAGIWTAALAGATIRAFAPDFLKLAAVALALMMGWAGLLAQGAVFTGLSLPVLMLIVVGGLLYTIGVGFFLFDRLPFHPPSGMSAC